MNNRKGCSEQNKAQRLEEMLLQLGQLSRALNDYYRAAAEPELIYEDICIAEAKLQEAADALGRVAGAELCRNLFNRS